MKVKILIAVEHFVVRVGIKATIEAQFNNVQIDMVEDYYEVLQKLENEQFDLIVLDINMKGDKFNLKVSELKKKYPDIKIIVFSEFKKKIELKHVSGGANAYINKHSTEDEIIKVIVSVVENGMNYIEKLNHNSINVLLNKKNNPFDNLSSREKEILSLLIDGNGNLEISNLSGLHVSTVSTYKKRIFKKLNINNIVELIEINSKFH